MKMICEYQDKCKVTSVEDCIHCIPHEYYEYNCNKGRCGLSNNRDIKCITVFEFEIRKVINENKISNL